MSAAEWERDWPACRGDPDQRDAQLIVLQSRLERANIFSANTPFGVKMFRARNPSIERLELHYSRIDKQWAVTPILTDQTADEQKVLDILLSPWNRATLKGRLLGDGLRQVHYLSRAEVRRAELEIRRSRSRSR